jgi:hypothetical protein
MRKLDFGQDPSIDGRGVWSKDGENEKKGAILGGMLTSS